MDELRQAILYGCLPLEIDFTEWTSLKDQLEIVRYIVANPKSLLRICTKNTPNDWVATLLRNTAAYSSSLRT
jgi:hypothetical protein